MIAKVVEKEFFDYGNIYAIRVYFECRPDKQNPFSFNPYGKVPDSITFNGISFRKHAVRWTYMAYRDANVPIAIYERAKIGSDDLSFVFDFKNEKADDLEFFEFPETFINHISNLQETELRTSNVINMLDWKKKKDRQEFAEEVL